MRTTNMRTTLAALSLAAGLGLICCPSANAFPINASAIGQSATAASAVQKAQYAERRGRRTITKCYRDLIFGRYRCHTYRNW
ncbi:MAG: hypothetical protein WBB34_11760 [Xanthobacteraceae bacterium]